MIEYVSNAGLVTAPAMCLHRGRSRRALGRRRAAKRSGLTLLEILLASAILAAALAALAQQNANGVRAALRSQLETDAAVGCQTVMNRLIAEGVPSSSVVDQSLNDDARWRWSASTTPSKFPGLLMLTVSVRQDGPNRDISSFSLSRLVPDEQQRSH